MGTVLPPRKAPRSASPADLPSGRNKLRHSLVQSATAPGQSRFGAATSTNRFYVSRGQESAGATDSDGAALVDGGVDVDGAVDRVTISRGLPLTQLSVK